MPTAHRHWGGRIVHDREVDNHFEDGRDTNIPRRSLAGDIPRDGRGSVPAASLISLPVADGEVSERA